MALPPKYPGVHIREIKKFPPSVSPVETAIPAFIGFTEIAKEQKSDDLINKPKRISSLAEYERFYGTAEDVGHIVVERVADDFVAYVENPPKHNLYYAIMAYFANGGGPCYIVSVGKLGDTITKEKFKTGLDATEKVDEVTLLVIPESHALVNYNPPHAPDLSLYAELMADALKSCAKLRDRFTIMDVPPDIPLTRFPRTPTSSQGTAVPEENIADAARLFRDAIPGHNLMYGASYIPNLESSFSYLYNEADVRVKKDNRSTVILAHINPAGRRDASGNIVPNANPDAALYAQAVQAIAYLPVYLPPAPFLAGIYANVDETRGVWKAPANVSLNGVSKPSAPIDDALQNILNVSPSGKSINAIRKFPGRGVLVWGARTLAGNSAEWRYVSVRRFVNFVEESVKKAAEPFTFEPNDRNTWTQISGMISNFLLIQWRYGALAGAKPEDAFFVKVGLPETMTSLDILEGRMNVEIGMAVVRPAEFIILKFSQKMQVS